MKRFNSISRNEALSIYDELIENSKVLLKSGKLLSEQNFHGVATSITILGGEELIKGALLYFHGIGINILRIKDLKSVFKNHLPKHEAAKLSELLKIFESFIRLEEMEVKTYSTKKWLNDIMLILDQTRVFLEPIADMSENLDWWGEADKLKNRGLYVDYYDELLTPNQITLEQFNKTANIMKELSNRFRLIKVFMEKAEREERNELVQQINKGLEIQINKDKC